jgi:hypothetical protein
MDFQESNLYLVNLIPERDCFRNLQPFSFFANQDGQFLKDTISQPKDTQICASFVGNSSTTEVH